MRHVIAYVNVAAVGDAAHQVVALIHAAPETVHEWRRLFLEFAQERAALQPLRRLEARETQQRGREIDEADEAIRLGAGFVFGRTEVLELFRDVHHQRHVQTGIARPALAARHA